MTTPPPAEWAQHSAIWTAWPTGDDLWPPEPSGARREVVAMINALSQTVDGKLGDRVKLLVKNEEAKQSAHAAVGSIADIIELPYGDIWMRDIAPIFKSASTASVFQVNGWGGKYVYEHDDKVAEGIISITGAAAQSNAFVLEGGAVEGDGSGLFLTTRECLLNPNRNPNWTGEGDAEHALATALGAQKVIWIERGLLKDHTDGHIDNIARFVGVGHVVCQSPTGQDDPNADILNEIYEKLSSASDQNGHPLKITRIPSPGRYVDEAGELAPASHMNFIIGNATVVMPIYTDHDHPAAQEALRILSEIFKDRRVVALPSRHILTGGGSFHCITQQQPA